MTALSFSWLDFHLCGCKIAFPPPDLKSISRQVERWRAEGASHLSLSLLFYQEKSNFQKVSSSRLLLSTCQLALSNRTTSILRQSKEVYVFILRPNLGYTTKKMEWVDTGNTAACHVHHKPKVEKKLDDLEWQCCHVPDFLCHLHLTAPIYTESWSGLSWFCWQ